MKKNDGNNTAPCIVFTGGGTGGHIFPGLAVAQELASASAVQLVWIGSSTGIDKSLVENEPCVTRFIGIPTGKLRRYFSLRNVVDVFKICAGFCAALWHLHRIKPAVLFSKGGFVSVPPCFAAKVLGIPVYTHECDYSPGLATKLNMRTAKKILVSFEETARFFSAERQKAVIVCGNPLRPAFYQTNPAEGLAFLQISKIRQKPLLLVLGGSQGARQINALVRENLDWLCERFIVVHQTGSVEGELVTPLHSDYRPYPFIYGQMPHVLAAADIVLSRAGSNTVWENAVTGRPMVLIPLAGSGTRGDQIENAAFFERRSAAIVLGPGTADSEHLRKALETLCDSSLRSAFSVAARNAAGTNRPAKTIARLLLEEIKK